MFVSKLQHTINKMIENLFICTSKYYNSFYIPGQRMFNELYYSMNTTIQK